MTESVATGSVGERMAPKTKASTKLMTGIPESPRSCRAMAPHAIASAERMVPGPANMMEDFQVVVRVSFLNVSPLSKMMGGRSRNRNRSGSNMNRGSDAAYPHPMASPMMIAKTDRGIHSSLILGAKKGHTSTSIMMPTMMTQSAETHVCGSGILMV